MKSLFGDVFSYKGWKIEENAKTLIKRLGKTNRQASSFPCAKTSNIVVINFTYFSKIVRICLRNTEIVSKIYGIPSTDHKNINLVNSV